MHAPFSLVNLFRGIVDYAGTFPPAGLALADALGEYARAKTSADVWLLGRFVMRLADLREFERHASELISLERGDPWELSIVVPPGIVPDFDDIARFNRRWRRRARIAAIEIPPIPTSEATALVTSAPTGVEMYFETPIDADLDCRLRSIKAAGAMAKVRTGGVHANAIPTAEDLCRFLEGTCAVDIPFKATAGLHHALRGCYPFTYEANSDAGTMHGFLNVTAAAAVLHSGGSARDSLQALLEESPDAFEFNETGLAWRGRKIESDDLAGMRRHLLRSFGSCAFQEPADDLRRLHRR